MRRDRLRVLNFERLTAMADKDEGIAVTPDTEDALYANVFNGLKILEAFRDLFDDRFDARRVLVLRYLARALGVLVFDDHPAVLRVDAPARQAVFVAAFDGHPCFLDEFVDEFVDLMPDVLFRPGPLNGLHHLIGHDVGVVFNQRFEILIHGVFTDRDSLRTDTDFNRP